MSDPDDITEILLAWEAGDSEALERLVPRVYDRLHRHAIRSLRSERRGHTLQPTALVNEAYLRLVDQNRIQWRGRAQFFAVAGQLMRRILVDHARRRRAAKRGEDPLLLPLDEALVPGGVSDVDLVALDDALTALEGFAPRQAQVIELRFFGGLSILEAAEVLKVSDGTVKLDWKMAKAWLFNELRQDGEASAAGAGGL